MTADAAMKAYCDAALFVRSSEEVVVRLKRWWYEIACNECAEKLA